MWLVQKLATWITMHYIYGALFSEVFLSSRLQKMCVHELFALGNVLERSVEKMFSNAEKKKLKKKTRMCAPR